VSGATKAPVRVASVAVVVGLARPSDTAATFSIARISYRPGAAHFPYSLGASQYSSYQLYW